MVTNIDGDMISIVEANFGGFCKINRRTVNRSTFMDGTVYYVLKFPGNIYQEYTQSITDCDEWHNVISNDGYMVVRTGPSSSYSDTGRRAYAENNPHHVIKKTRTGNLDWGWVEDLDGWIALGNNYTELTSAPAVVPTPGKPSVSVYPGDSLHETIFAWDGTSDTDWYDVRIYRNDEGEAFYGRAYQENIKFSALLPAGTYGVTIASVNGWYKTYSESDRISFTVQSASVSGLGEMTYDKVWNGHKYALYQKNCSWLEAKSLAEQSGGHLMTITSQEEQNIANDLIGKVNAWAWIGTESFSASDWDTTRWRWVTDEAFTFSNWANGEPNYGSGLENCAHLCADGTWNDIQCSRGSDMYGYIVEYEDTYYGEEMTTGYDRVLPDGDYMIAADCNPKYFLDIVGAAPVAERGTNVQLWSADSFENCDWDAWTITYSDGFYTIKQFNTDMVLDVLNGSTVNGGNVIIANNNGSSAQKWAISEISSGVYRLQAKCSGLSLDITGGTIEEGTNVEQWSSHDGDAQRWVFIPYESKPTSISVECKNATWVYGWDRIRNNLTVSATYANGDTIVVDDYTIDDPADIRGNQTITVHYGGKTASCEVELLNPVTMEAHLSTYVWPKCTSLVWQSMNKDLTCTVTYDDGSTETVAFKGEHWNNVKWDETYHPLMIVVKKIGDGTGLGTFDFKIYYGDIYDTITVRFVEVPESITPNLTPTIWPEYNNSLMHSKILKAWETCTVTATYKDGRTEEIPMSDCTLTNDEQMRRVMLRQVEMPYVGTAGFIVKYVGLESTVTVTFVDTQAVLNSPDLALPAALTAIDEEAFSGLPMASVRCNDNLEEIGARAFANCANLREIYIPESVVSISRTAFTGCPADLIIFGTKGSVAETYAKSKGYTFLEVTK